MGWSMIMDEWDYHGMIMDEWDYHGMIMDEWDYHGMIMDEWDYHGIIMGLSWDFSRSSHESWMWWKNNLLVGLSH